MKRITMTNNFHNSEANVIPQEITEGRFKGFHKISRKTAMRLRRELCGLSDCVCGGNFGERGGNHLDVVGQDYELNFIVDLRGSNL